MPATPRSAAAGWFAAAEALGDFMGIRYGRLVEGTDKVEWHFIPHTECDGIGGFARLLRQHGAPIPELPKSRQPCQGTVGPLWRLWCARHRPSTCARRHDWATTSHPGAAGQPEVAWHLFSEDQTRRLIENCRQQHITVNSLLLMHLDAAVREDTGIIHASLPWMIPVNLRGGVTLPDDTANHVSSIDVLVTPGEPAATIHQQIRKRLALGEHRAKYLLLQIGGLLSHRWKCRYLARDRTLANGNFGVFSNLGCWDPECRIDCRDRWLFCPPIVTGQRVAAGCVTYQNRLALMVQTHRDEMPGMAAKWIGRWVAGIAQSAESPNGGQ